MGKRKSVKEVRKNTLTCIQKAETRCVVCRRCADTLPACPPAAPPGVHLASAPCLCGDAGVGLAAIVILCVAGSLSYLARHWLGGGEVDRWRSGGGLRGGPFSSSGGLSLIQEQMDGASGAVVQQGL